MKIFAKNAAGPWGFTLVELLTVIAIIAVLATLTSASLVNAQRKGRKAVSTSNLRQIAVAFNLYADDQQKRPLSFRQIVDAKYLNERVLLCPEDRIVKNWAGVLERQDSARQPNSATEKPDRDLPATGAEPLEDLPHSYFKSFDYIDRVWETIDRSSVGGVAACQLHGIGRPSDPKSPSMSDYQGLVLRALKDGSVIQRQVFWANGEAGTSINPGEQGGEKDAPSTMLPGSSQLPLFLDPAE